MSQHLNFFPAPERERQLIAEAERHDRQVRAMRSQVTVPIAINTAATAAAYPTLDPGVIAAVSLAGIPADNPMLLEVAMRSWERDQQFWDVAYTALKGTTRIAGTIAQSFYEELISRPIRIGVGALQGIPDPVGQSGSSVGVRALQEIAAGRRVNLGSGFLPGNDVADPDDPNVQRLVEGGVPEDEAIQAVQGQYGAPIWDQYIADSERIKFRGMPVSPGRLAAGVFALEPGSLPYNVFSGTIDAVSQVVLDPTTKLLVGFKIPRFVGGTLAGKGPRGISGIRQDMKRFAGISREGSLRDSVYKPFLNTFLDDREGQFLFDALFEHKDDSVALARIFSRSGKASPPSQVIDSVGQVQTRSGLGPVMRGETEVGLSDILQTPGLTAADIGGTGLADVAKALPRTPVANRLSGAIGTRLGPGLSGVFQPLGGARVSPELGRVLGFKASVGHSIDGTRLGRLFNTMPGRQLDFLNLDAGARTLDDWMVEAKFGYDKRNEILKKWHGLNRAESVQSDFYELVLGDVAEEFAKNITRDIVPRPVAARGKDAIAIWKAGKAKKGEAGPEHTKMVQMFEDGVKEWFDGMDDIRRYFTGDAADVPFPGSRQRVLGNGKIIEQPTAHLLAEYLNRGFSLPDAREVRRAVSEISEIVTTDALQLKLLPQLFDTYMQKIWKPLVLLRVAFPIRVQGDNQARMAVAGLDSVFRHPMDWLSWAIADPTDGSIAAILRGAGKVLPERDGAKLSLGRSPRGGTGITARDFVDELTGEVGEIFTPLMAAPQAKAALTHKGSSILGYQPGIEDPGDVVYTLLHNTIAGEAAPGGFMEGWVSEVMQLAGDVVAPRVARGKNEAKVWFWSTDEGRAARHALADTDKKKVFIDDAAARAEGYANAKAASDTYIESVWARIHEKAGGGFKWERHADGRITYSSIKDGNSEIIDAIGSGRLRVGGKDLDLATVGDKRYRAISEHFARKYYDEWAPDSIKIHDTSRVQGTAISAWDGFVGRMFEALASTPENVLSRSPAFRQFYWSRVEEMMPWMDETARTQTLRAAKAANLDSATVNRFARASKESVNTRSISSMEAVENIAMTYALDETRQLLYDLHKRSNFMDIARNIFPFGEAWVEILTRWSTLVYDHPETLRKFQQVTEGARRSGFVTTDPVTGQEVFNYPGSGLLSNWMLSGANPAGPLVGAAAGVGAGVLAGSLPAAIVGGVTGAAAGAFAGGAAVGDQGGDEGGAALQLQGQVQGINLVAASYLPGLGPLIQAPLARLMGTEWAMGKTQFDWLREQMFPFGAPPVNSVSDMAKLTLPAWGKKILTPLATGDPSFARLHAHSTIDVMRALLQTPGYSKDSPAQMLRLENDGKKIATNLAIIRGFLQFGLPTGPQIRYYAAAKGENPETNGKFYLFQTLASEYRKMLEARNFDDVAAFDDFRERFGLDPVDFITSKTTAAVKRGVTVESFDWERTNPGTFKQYPLTAYYAGPDDPNDEFDLRAWTRQLDEGTRVEYTPKQWLSARNNTIGRAAYNEAVRKIQANRLQRGEDSLTTYNSTERVYLRDMKIWLKTEYPGYNVNNVGTPTKGSIEQQISELQTWADDATLAGTGAGKGVALYLQARQQVIDRVTANGYGPTAFQRGNLDGNGEQYRQYLRNYAGWLVNQPQYRDFGPVWLGVLSVELKDDIGDDTVQAAA